MVVLVVPEAVVDQASPTKRSFISCSQYGAVAFVHSNGAVSCILMNPEDGAGFISARNLRLFECCFPGSVKKSSGFSSWLSFLMIDSAKFRIGYAKEK